MLGEDEIHDLEPSLNDRVKAGFHLAEQWNVKADTLVDGLATRLREMGVEFLEGAEVIEFDRTDSAVRSSARGPATSAETTSCSPPGRGRRLSPPGSA